MHAPDGITCPICRRNERLVLKDGVLNRYECHDCDHSFTAIDEKHRAQYNEEYYISKNAWFDNPNRWLFAFIHSNIAGTIKKDRIKVLDAGCGKGDFLKYVRSHDPDVELYGIDLTGNRYDGINFIKGDILKEKYDMKFDVICSLAVIEHIDDINLFAERLSGLLSPGGVIVLMTDNTKGIFYTVARILNKIGITTPYRSLYEIAHLHHFTNSSLKGLMKRHGFETVLHKNHNYPIKAIVLPECGILMKTVYSLGARLLFLFPSRFGILQTVFFKRSQEAA